MIRPNIKTSRKGREYRSRHGRCRVCRKATGSSWALCPDCHKRLAISDHWLVTSIQRMLDYQGQIRADTKRLNQREVRRLGLVLLHNLEKTRLRRLAASDPDLAGEIRLLLEDCNLGREMMRRRCMSTNQTPPGDPPPNKPDESPMKPVSPADRYQVEPPDAYRD